MKTLCTNPVTRLTARVGKFLIISSALVLLAVSTKAQTPLSVGASGVPVNDFSALPSLALGWSYLNSGGAAGDQTNAVQMDAAVALLTAAGITQELTINTTTTNATTSNPNMPAAPAGTCQRWNNVGNYICSRPTGIRMGVMMLTMLNNSGADRPIIVVNYDFGNSIPSAANTDEDPRGNTTHELGGFRVYYSLTGLANSWTHIPELDGMTAGAKSVNVNLTSSWLQNQNLYLIWCDDNAVNGSGGDTGTIEGAWTMDNFSLGFGVCVPPSITTQPHSVVIENCERTNLTVVAEGTSATYQWFRDNSQITGATSPTLVISNAMGVPDAGSYFVRVTACMQSVDSDTVTVTVNTTSPTLVQGLVRCDLTNITLTFSQTMLDSGTTELTAYHINALDGGNVPNIQAVTLVNGIGSATVTLGLQGPGLTANKNYTLTIDPNVANCAGEGVSPGSNLPLHYELCLLTAENTNWKYNHPASNLGTDWRLEAAYDDTTGTWSNGVSILDGKNPVRTTVNGLPVMTQIPLRIPEYETGLSNVPVYYFRTHFNFPTAPADIISLNLRTFVDDFDVAWFNNHSSPAHRDPGLPMAVDIDDFTYSAGNAVGDANFSTPYAISSSEVQYGDNLVAAKLWNVNSTSSDITFAYELIAIVSQFRVPVTLSISQSGANVIVTWTDGSLNLYSAISLDGPWTLVNPQAAGTATVAHTGTAKFFTLRQ